MTSASRPASDGCTVAASFMQAIGVQGTSVGSLAASRPTLMRMEAVDILVRVNAADDARGIDLRRQRQLHQNAVHRGIGIQLGDQRQ